MNPLSDSKTIVARVDEDGGVTPTILRPSFVEGNIQGPYDNYHEIEGMEKYINYHDFSDEKLGAFLLKDLIQEKISPQQLIEPPLDAFLDLPSTPKPLDTLKNWQAGMVEELRSRIPARDSEGKPLILIGNE